MKSRGRPKGSPNKKGKKDRAKLQVVISAQLLARLESITETTGTPKSWIVEKALEEYLK